MNTFLDGSRYPGPVFCRRGANKLTKSPVEVCERLETYLVGYLADAQVCVLCSNSFACSMRTRLKYSTNVRPVSSLNLLQKWNVLTLRARAICSSLTGSNLCSAI